MSESAWPFLPRGVEPGARVKHVVCSPETSMLYSLQQPKLRVGSPKVVLNPSTIFNWPGKILEY